jgi:hypothetical protein
MQELAYVDSEDLPQDEVGGVTHEFTLEVEFAYAAMCPSLFLYFIYSFIGEEKFVFFMINDLNHNVCSYLLLKLNVI